MADEWIKVGMSFTVTCNITRPDGTALLTLTEQSGHLVYYKRPDGVTGTLDVDNLTDTTMRCTVPVSLNPLTVSGAIDKWKNGYAGAWEFYPYCVGSGAAVFRGKEGIQIIHPQWRNAP